VVLVSTSSDIFKQVEVELAKQLEKLPRKALAEESLKHSLFVQVPNESEAFDFINAYAPEHLIINAVNADALLDQVKNAGSVFLGAYSPESAGDYASGTNHTLPTNGFAKAYSGVSLSSFQKFITVQSITQAGLKNLGPAVIAMAEAENLSGHAEAVRVRFNAMS
jgi:histidinol dehydrogenase